jgi:hypothetical protein
LLQSVDLDGDELAVVAEKVSQTGPFELRANDFSVRWEANSEAKIPFIASMRCSFGITRAP